MKIKEIKRRLQKKCAVCGGAIRIFIYKGGTYRGGHYFGDIPLYSKSEKRKMSESGTHKWKIGGREFDVQNYEGKPYKKVEYWECPKCYWGGK